MNNLYHLPKKTNDITTRICETICEMRFASIHAVKECYRSIILACEHTHAGEADLASLAGGILLEITKSSFFYSFSCPRSSFRRSQ